MSTSAWAIVLVVEVGKFTSVPNRGKCVQVLDTSIAVEIVDDPAVICTRYPVKSVDGGVTLQFAVVVPPEATVTGTLPVLTGVRIEIEGSSISLLATDRFRLSHRELTWDPGATDVSAAALVPAKVLADTAKSLTSGTEVTIALASSGAGEGIIGFEGASGGGVRRTTTRLLDGEFPKVRTLFPAEHSTVARIESGSPLPLGERLRVRLARADLGPSKVLFVPA